MNETPNPESPTTPENNASKKKVVAVILFIAVLVVIVLAWSLMNAKNAQTETSNDNTQLQNSPAEQNTDASQDRGSAAEETIDTRITSSEVFFTTEEFLKKNSSLTSSQADFIKTLTGFYDPITDGSDEHSTVITSLTDMKDPNVIYVAYSTWDPTSDEFYRMDSKTGKTESILKTGSAAYTLELYGQQGRKLLFLSKALGDSPGPCANMWTYVYENPISDSAQEIADGYYGFRTFQSLDLDNVQAGLKYYPVSKEKYEIESKVKEQCMAKFDAEMENEE